MLPTKSRPLFTQFFRKLLPFFPSPKPKDPLSIEIQKATEIIRPVKPFKDPFSIVSSEMSNMASNIASLLGSNHPTLNKVANYYFETEGKHVRPLIVLLLSKSLSYVPPPQRIKQVDNEDVQTQKEVDDPLSPLSILQEVSPKVVLNPLSKPLSKFDSEIEGILPKQRRLAEIVEMIHTASLLHDDVIDNSSERRSKPSGNSAFGNKMSILAGDFLLGRASVAIARLRNAEVIELLSTTIANLVEGEFMQLKNTANVKGSLVTKVSFEYYIHKTYLKTASLMSKSCRSAAVLASVNEELVDACYNFGRNLGLCFQIVDDMLDYTAVDDAQLGKPSGADLKLGLATAPVLYAWEQFPELGALIKRKFSMPGDAEIARDLVLKAGGVEKTRRLAVHYHNAALKELDKLPDSEACNGLKSLTHTILSRTK